MSTTQHGTMPTQYDMHSCHIVAHVIESNRVIHKVIGSFGVRYFRDSLYAVSLSVTGKYPKFAKISHP